MGPGFDCLGLALDLWNEVAAVPADAPTLVGLDGAIDTAVDAADNLIVRAARAVAERVGAPLPVWELRCTNRVPMARGMGSSAAAIVTGVLLGNRALGDPLPPGELLDLATALEGHPDNVAPALFGGVRVAAVDEQGHVVQAAVRPALRLSTVVFVPQVRLSTQMARAALPTTVPFADALFNVSRACLLVAALASGEANALREATRDRLHQTYRAAQFPTGLKLVEAALDAGALGAFISGAGPSVLALCGAEDVHKGVADAMTRAAQQGGTAGEALHLEIAMHGASVDYVE